MKSKIVAICVCGLMILSGMSMLFSPFTLNATGAGGAFGGGDGSPGNPYIIEDVLDLQAMNDNKAAYYVLANDIDASDTINWNGGAGFVQVGSGTPFSGGFDGRNFTITGLYINLPTTDYVGLFGYSIGRIGNVALADCNITGQNYVGGLVGYESDSNVIVNCHCTGTVTGTGDYVGGLVGVNFNGDVTASTADCYVIGADNVGGLLGYNYGMSFIPCLVSGCRASGNVTGANYVGGLVGLNDGGDGGGTTVTKCYSLGNVFGISFTGGLIGNNLNGIITNSYSKAETTRSSGTMTSFGGFVGENCWGSINYCYSTGRVRYHNATDPTDKGFAGSILTGGIYDMTANFWDTETSLQSSTMGGAVGRTTSMMKTQSTFTNASWDFVSIWWMLETITYPILVGQFYDPPRADAGIDQVIPRDGTAFFDGTGSHDEVGIANFTWTFDYNATEQTVFGPAPSFSFYEYGVYIVTLNATNAGGLWDIDEMTVTVVDGTPPVAIAGPDQIVDENTVVTFNGSLSTDNFGIVGYYWNFTDISQKTLTGIFPTYRFIRPGIYNVTLEAVDAIGNRGTDCVFITVNDIYLPLIRDTTAGFAVNGQDFAFTCIVKESSIAGVFLNYSIETVYGTDGPFSVTMDPEFSRNVPIPQYARKIRYSMHVMDNVSSWASTPETEIDAHSWDKDTLLYSPIFNPNPKPKAFPYYGLEYDAINDNIFLFNGDWTGRNWTYDTDTRTFTEIVVNSIPPRLNYYDMVYDSDSERMVIFGGAFPANNQVFEYDPTTQTWYGPFTPAGSPPPTYSHSMAYDPVNQVVIVFGGNQGGSTSRNTWEYHPAERHWTGPYANPSMSLRVAAAMEYDPTIQRTVLFGGAYITYLSDTWEYDSTYHTWTGPFNPATRPSARASAEMVFNPTNGRMALFGGENLTGRLSDTWEYDSSSRTWLGPYNPTNKPAARTDFGMAYDRQSDKFVIYGGLDGVWLSSIGEGYHDYSPVSRAGANIFVDRYAPFDIDGMASSDDFSINNYTWTYDEGGVKTLWGASHRVIFTIPGSYPVQLNVTDGRGQWDLDWILVTVNDTNSPVANAGVDQTIVQGDFIVSDGYGSWDDIGITSYTWTFVDGTLQTLTGVEWLWFFNNAGTFIVTLNVTDADGNWDTDIMIVTVIDTTPPIANAGPDQTVDEDVPMAFDGSLSTDNVGVMNHTWTFTDSGTKTLWGAGPSYTFGTPGNYTVTLTARDAAGNSDTDTVLINVRDKTPPVITDTTAGWAVNGQTFNVTCYVKDNFSPIDSVFINYSFETAYGIEGPFNVTMNGTYYMKLQIPQYARIIRYSIHAIDSCGWSAELNKILDAKSNEAVTMLYSGALNPSPRPTARYGLGMDYNPDIDGIIIFGGNGGDSITWIYDANIHTYNNPAPGQSPISVSFFDLAYDSDNRRTIMFGGFTANNRIYEYDAISNTWFGPFTPAGPPTMYSHSMAYDPVNEVMVVFGGIQGGSFSRNTWEYHPAGRYWTGPYSNPSMAARMSAAMEWDPTIQKMVMFGGSSSGTDQSDVWEYSTTTHIWSGPYTPATRPTARSAMQMTYIPTTGRLVMFGGSTGGSDTWEYDASARLWTGPFNPTNKPGSRTYYGMTYDQQSDKFVIFGGIFSTTLLSDTNEGSYDYAPLSRAGPNLFVNEGTPLSFSGATSTDDIGITNYTWTFNDGVARTLWGSSPSHTFTTPGTYLVELKVKDSRNQWDSDWILVTVNSTEIPFSIPISLGWNLVSIPLEMDNTTVEQLLSSISGKWDVVKCYDTLDVADPWKSYRVSGTANDLTDLDRTMGFWLNATEACWLNVSGNLPVSTAITLHAGWNLVGYPSMGQKAVSVALAGTGYDLVEGFMATTPYIQPLGDSYMMKPGEAYWVHVPADSIWTINW